MRKKFMPFLVSLLIFAGASAYSQGYAAYEIDSPINTRLPHVVNPKRILSAKEEFQLNKQLDSIKTAGGMDMVFVLIPQIYSNYRGNDSFAATLKDKWESNHRRDDLFILVYTKNNNKLGYWMGDFLKKAAVDSLMTEMLDAELILSLRKKKYLSSFQSIAAQSQALVRQRLAYEISELTSLEEEEKKTKQTEAERIAQIRDEIWIYDNLLAAVILVLAVWLTKLWIDRKGRMAYRKYGYDNQVNEYLNWRLFFMGCFYVTLFMLLNYQLSRTIANAEYFHITILVATLIAFFGWIPCIMYMSTKRPVRGSEFGSSQPFFTPPESVYPANTPRPNTLPNTARTLPREERRPRNSEKININKASAEQLRNLSSLVTLMDANRIIQERNTRGDYANSTDLADRTQLVASLVQEIADRVVFEPSNPDSSPRGRVLDIS